MLLISCPACGLHVRRIDASCPHCDAHLSVTPSRALVLCASLGAGLTMLACSDSGTGDGSSDGMSTTAMSSTNTGEDSSTTTDDSTSSTTMDATDTTMGTDTMSETETTSAPEPPYGVPDQPCEEFGPEPVTVGANAVELFAGAGALPGSCGGSGSGNLYAFTAEADGDYELTVIDADFDDLVVSLFGYSCWDFETLNCGMPPEALQVTLSAGETLHIVVDSTESTDGTATLTITPQ